MEKSIVILINTVFRAVKIYYLQVFLEECKCVVKEKRMSEYITDEIGIWLYSDRENFDEENPNEENPDEENSDEENSDDENPN